MTPAPSPQPQETRAPDMPSGEEGPRSWRWLGWLVVALFGWLGLAVALVVVSWRPWQAEEEAWREGLRQGQGGAAEVARACLGDDEDRGLIPLQWENSEEEARHALAQWLYRFGCLDLLAPADVEAFTAQNIWWLLSSQPSISASQLLGHLLRGSPPALQRRVAVQMTALGAQLAAALTPEEQGALLAFAALHLEENVYQRLLFALGTDDALQVAARAYLAEDHGDEAGVAALSPHSRRHLEGALIEVWPRLDAEVQARLVAQWVEVAWQLRRSGSIGQPQPLGLSVRRFPSPHPAWQEAQLVVQVREVRLDNSPLRLGGAPASQRFTTVASRAPGAWSQVVDLQDALTSATHFHLHATAEFFVLPPSLDGATSPVDAQGELLAAWQAAAWYQGKAEINQRRYRVYLGSEQGPPSTEKDGQVNTALAAKLRLSLHNQRGESVLLWEGALREAGRQPLGYRHGEDLFLLAESAVPLEMALGLRVLGSVAGRGWREIGGHRVSQRLTHPALPPQRIELGLGELCLLPGACEVELRLRPSLRFARPDPSISVYWGGGIDLGQVTLTVENSADGWHWPALQQSMVGLLADPS